MRAHLASLMTVILITGGARVARANEASREKAREAILVCESVDQMPASDRTHRAQRLDEGLAMSEAAVRADERDARAHLAMCCNLGKQIELAGLSWRVFSQIRRMQAEADRAQELAQDDADVLITKGEMLRRLPGPLGGNKEAGMRLLRRAVELRPDHVVGRVYLARALADERSPAARASLYEALALAKRTGAQREQTEVQHLLASLAE